MAGRSAHVRRPISSFQSHEHNNNTSSSSSGSNHASTGPGTFTSQIPVPIMHMRTPDRRRSSSQGDATPRAPAHALAQADSPQPQTQTQASASEHPSKRLGFLGDILLSSAGSIATSASTQRASPIPHGLLPARTHSRGDSGYNRDNASSPIPPMASSAGQPAKGHTSPSKGVCGQMLPIRLV
ncbi:hypothetical protein C8Q79DRAFT_927548 [Trametes meyenii]|nr:hypothetical protein C8Q79DRAFT_927548 [Trametes meyenii]